MKWVRVIIGENNFHSHENTRYSIFNIGKESKINISILYSYESTTVFGLYKTYTKHGNAIFSNLYFEISFSIP